MSKHYLKIYANLLLGELNCPTIYHPKKRHYIMNEELMTPEQVQMFWLQLLS